MTIVKQAGLLRSARSWGVLGLALAALALATDGAFAVSPCMVTDRAKACTSHGGIWNLHLKPAASCLEHSGGVPVTCPCGGCYYPNITDCLQVNGTWHPAASPPPPFAYCTLPGGGIQATWPEDPGGGGTSGSGGIDCSRYGLVSNEIGGCRRPTVCDADPDAEGCRAQRKSAPKN
jgi:hypothetical protein